MFVDILILKLVLSQQSINLHYFYDRFSSLTYLIIGTSYLQVEFCFI